MKRILVTITALLGVVYLPGCASMFFPSTWAASGWTSSDGGGIDPITQAANDDIARRTQEDAAQMTESIAAQNAANDMANAATAAASAAAAAAGSP